ncbi:TAP-like domain containing protein [Naviculisporaceae sp. PSN 640]
MVRQRRPSYGLNMPSTSKGILFLCLTLCSFMLASPTLAKPFNTRGQTAEIASLIKWGPCDVEAEGLFPVNGYPNIDVYPVQCATLSVPLDYTNPTSNQTFILELLRSPAPNQPSRGSILLNFGGPGVPGFAELFYSAPLLHSYTGGYHDLVVFKPRGTGKSAGLLCARQDDDKDTPEDITEFSDLESILENPNEWIFSWNTTKTMVEKTVKVTEKSYAKCAENHKNGGIPEYVGTTFVARDMMQIVDALGEDGLLRYWGISYGSLLGVTVATMFPDRIDRLICDGVANAFEYYDRGQLSHLIESNEKFLAVLDECLAAGADKCALAQDVDTGITSRPEQVQLLAKAIESLWHRLHQTPIKVENGVVTSGDVIRLRDNLISVPLGTTAGEALESARHLHNLLNDQNLPELILARELDNERKKEASKYVQELSWPFIAIACGDRTGVQAHPETLDDLVSEAKLRVNTSQLWGHQSAYSGALCAKWPFESKEKFNTSLFLLEGGVQTRKPLLFIGTTYDTRTPLQNARNMSSYFARSAVLEQRGFGHGSFLAPSTCTRKAVKSYIMDGKIPPNNTVCKEDQALFETTSSSSPSTVNLLLPILISMGVAVYHR